MKYRVWLSKKAKARFYPSAIIKKTAKWLAEFGFS